MPILLFINLKGGVAKTTNAIAIAECLADKGLRTLVIDADHQCMASELLLGEARLLRCEQRRTTLHDLLGTLLDEKFESDGLPSFTVSGVSNIAGGLEHLSVLPSSIRIDDFQTNMAKARRGFHSSNEFLSILRGRKVALRRWLTENYDYTIVDCPPSIALQVRLLVSIADAFIAPCVPERLAIRGTYWLLDRLHRLGSRIPPLGTLWTFYREQNPIHRRIVQRATTLTPPFDRLPLPFETIIPNSAAIARACEADNQPRSFTSKYSPPIAALFRAICGEIQQRLEILE